MGLLENRIYKCSKQFITKELEWSWALSGHFPYKVYVPKQENIHLIYVATNIFLEYHKILNKPTRDVIFRPHFNEQQTN